MSAEKILELAYRRFNLINELQHINSQLLIQYETIVIEASKGQVDISAIAKVLTEADIHAVKSRMPVLSKATPAQTAPAQEVTTSTSSTVQEEVKVNPVIEDVIDSSNVKPHITDPDEDVDDKANIKDKATEDIEWTRKIAEIKQSENYLLSIQSNKTSVDNAKKKYDEMSDDKKLDFRTKNVPIITKRISELSKTNTTKDPKTAVANELAIQYYKDYLSCITSK